MKIIRIFCLLLTLLSNVAVGMEETETVDPDIDHSAIPPAPEKRYCQEEDIKYILLEVIKKGAGFGIKLLPPHVGEDELLKIIVMEDNPNPSGHKHPFFGTAALIHADVHNRLTLYHMCPMNIAFIATHVLAVGAVLGSLTTYLLMKRKKNAQETSEKPSHNKK